MNEWAVKDSNSPANRDIFPPVGAPVGARRALERSSPTRVNASVRDWFGRYWA
jgi:hypothetical protein